MSRLPSLTALTYFEAAARTRSFSAAAKELHITPAAISHQIKSLEEQLGVQLFVRHSRRISLTPAAIAALPQLKEGFERLHEAVQQIQMYGESSSIVTICAEPLFATKWIIPRLHRFYTRYPEAEVRLQASLNSVDRSRASSANAASFERAGIDLSIRLGYGAHSDLNAEHLFDLELTPLCTPATANALDGPRSLLELSLLSDGTFSRFEDSPSWSSWFEAADIKPTKKLREVRFGNGLLALEAAITGQGPFLGCPRLMQSQMRSNKIVQPFDTLLRCPQSYFLTYIKQHVERPIARDFREWLIEEMNSNNSDSA